MYSVFGMSLCVCLVCLHVILCMFISITQSYRQDLPKQYELLKDVVATGNELATLVADGSPAHKHIDTIVRGTTVRWKELVNSLKQMEEDLSNVLITWQVSSIVLLPYTAYCSKHVNFVDFMIFSEFVKYKFIKF